MSVERSEAPRLICDDSVSISLPTHSSTRLRWMHWNDGLGLERGFHNQAADQQRVCDIAGLFTTVYS